MVLHKNTARKMLGLSQSIWWSTKTDWTVWTGWAQNCWDLGQTLYDDVRGDRTRQCGHPRTWPVGTVSTITSKVFTSVERMHSTETNWEGQPSSHRLTQVYLENWSCVWLTINNVYNYNSYKQLLKEGGSLWKPHSPKNHRHLILTTFIYYRIK